METPNLDNLINDLETYDRMDMLSDNGRNQLNEYRKIKQALRIHDVVGRSEQLPCGDCKPMEYDVEGIRYFKCRKCGLPMK
jgi:hypothetical protein